MDRVTADQLNEINLAFYREHAADFSASRESSWPGWQRLLPHLEKLPEGLVRVLDVGCGNARFARFLRAEFERAVDYTGLDISRELLSQAAERVPDATWVEADLVARLPDQVLPAGPFELVVGFGLLHHVPGEALRHRLVRAMAGRLAPGGLLVLAFWDFGERERFLRRRISWQEHNQRSSRPVALDQLDPGDTLLRWGPETEDAPYRYCHHAGPAERERALAASGLVLIEEFAADGEGLNIYSVLCHE